MTGIQPGESGHPAQWWHPMPNGQVVCELCPIGCRLREGVQGPCGTRANKKGVMVPLHYGQAVAGSTDPMEKKPLYHFHPGKNILSVAAPGRNLHCLFARTGTSARRQLLPPTR